VIDSFSVAEEEGLATSRQEKQSKDSIEEEVQNINGRN